MFSAYFWGSFISGFPAGLLADRYGPKVSPSPTSSVSFPVTYFQKLVVLALVVNGVGSLLTPTTAVHGGFIGLFVVRFLMGLGQGAVNPCAGALTARWHSPLEKSTVAAIVTGPPNFTYFLLFLRRLRLLPIRESM